jgi:hypothetical protein
MSKTNPNEKFSKESLSETEKTHRTSLPKRQEGTASVFRLPKAVGNQAASALFTTETDQRRLAPRQSSESADALASLGAGQSLDPIVQSRMSSALGSDFSGVRVHTGGDLPSSSLNARAFTVGNHVAFAAGEYQPGTLLGDTLLAHELAHTIQQSGAGVATSSGPIFSSPEAALEHDANTSASFMASAWTNSKGTLQSIARNTRPSLKSGLRIQRCSVTKKPAQDVQDALDGKTPWTAPVAKKTLDYYRGLSEGDKAAIFTKTFPTGRLQLLMGALPPDDAGGAYNDAVQDILRRVQRAGALESAKSSGLADEGAMARSQATFMEAKNRPAAQAALPVGVAPTTAQIAAQQASQVASTSIAPSVNTLTAPQIASWTTRANAAVATVVTYAAAHYPELHLTAADFHVDIVGIETRGVGVIAYGENIGGKRVATVGRTFVRYVDKNPAYAMSAVYHELHGHPEYGPYSQPGSEYGLELYDKSAALMPGYVKPAGAGRTSEVDAFGYQETEIYSLLRSLPYHTPLAPADAALQPDYVDPEPTVKNHIASIKIQWEPKVAKALLRGLYVRLRMDPTINAAALHAFERSVKANYTGADAPIANDILK